MNLNFGNTYLQMIRILNLILLALLPGFCPNISSAKVGNGKVDSPGGANIDFQKNFTGTINGKLKVVFQIENKGGELSGFYFYASKGADIKLNGTMTGQRLEIYEMDNSNNKTAKISGELKNSIFTGTWQSLGTNKILPMNLKETNAKVVPIPSNIEGTYKTQANDSTDHSPCEVAVTITKDNGAYFYQLNTKSRNYKGNITFYRDIEANEIYITLKGIRWSEYGGDMSNPNKKVKTEKSKNIPVDIEGLYAENEITVQNDGNAMNYYVVLGECDRKYIRLVKQ
jgi:hypothetical protein